MVAVMAAVTAEATDSPEVTDSPAEAMDCMAEAAGSMVEVVNTMAEDIVDTTADVDTMDTMDTADTIGIMGTGITVAGGIRGSPVSVGGIRGTIGIRIMGIPITMTIPITVLTIATRITAATIGIDIPIIIGTIVTPITATATTHTRDIVTELGFGPTVLHVSELDVPHGASSSADSVTKS